MSLGLSAGVHRVMAAHSTHQAFKGSGKTAQMTAGFAPHRETANLPASHLQGQPLLLELQETIARGAATWRSRSRRAPDDSWIASPTLAMTTMVQPIRSSPEAD